MGQHGVCNARERQAILERLGFPPEKIPLVVEIIRTHQPAQEPESLEGKILRDADILEQLGAIGILRHGFQSRARHTVP